MKKIPWDKYETALLIESYIEIVDKKKKRADVVRDLSATLRKRAINLGLDIDDIFRNQNGISFRLEEIKYLFLDGQKGLSHTSKMFRDTVELYRNSQDDFDRLLVYAKAILVYPEGYKKEYQKMVSLLSNNPEGNEFAVEDFLLRVFS